VSYADLCREFVPSCDPRHVEAWIRFEHSTLEGLSRDRFRYEALIAERCIREAGVEQSEALAKSFGL
jgi:hypothetical protein